MRFASLGSGSRGNALLVESGKTRVLIDAGFGPRETSRRLARLAVPESGVDAILVTHEHRDHVGGAFACSGRFGWRLMMTAGTRAACRGHASGVEASTIDGHCSFELGGLSIQPFPVPHDAREPVQYVLTDGASRLGVLTDAGHVTPHMVAMLDCCDALVLECNHDSAMLASGNYPYALKQRIAGSLGHLDNTAAASLLARVDSSRLRHVIAAHLSEQNNTPELARAALCNVLNCDPAWIGIASQAAGFDWREI
ncbi:MAG: MBL fold metallo-hydrolase [Rhodocyclales bacterium]|nr:MBL fold metallo-hydrolase [Rhodocyclales bacterium]